MKPGEHEALDAMKAECVKIDATTIFSCEYSIRMRPEDLIASGHKTIGDALIYTIKSGMEKKKRVSSAFTRQFPDD